MKPVPGFLLVHINQHHWLIHCVVNPTTLTSPTLGAQCHRTRYPGNLGDLRQIRQYLTRDAALMAANALVGSRLDYCNSLFRGLSVSNLRKLQCIQNSLARIVCRATCLSHTTPLRKALHWLPIRHRCIFKTALLVYKYLHTNCPKYFSPFLKV